MKNEYMVALQFMLKQEISSSPEKEIARFIKINTGELECVKGKKGITCKITSKIPDEKSLINHLSSIITKIKECNYDKKAGSIKEIKLAIGVFFYTPYCVVNLDNKLIRKFFALFPDINVTIRCYPCEEPANKEV